MASREPCYHRLFDTCFQKSMVLYFGRIWRSESRFPDISVQVQDAEILRLLSNYIPRNWYTSANSRETHFCRRQRSNTRADTVHL